MALIRWRSCQGQCEGQGEMKLKINSWWHYQQVVVGLRLKGLLVQNNFGGSVHFIGIVMPPVWKKDQGWSPCRDTSGCDTCQPLGGQHPSPNFYCTILLPPKHANSNTRFKFKQPLLILNTNRNILKISCSWSTKINVLYRSKNEVLM